MLHAPRIVLFGPMGIGKSTAIRAVCGDLAVDCDVVNFDPNNTKAMTTVGADYGVIHLADGQELHLYGAPGQERFGFMREWLMSLAIGALVLVDVNTPDAVAQASALLKAAGSDTGGVTCVVVAARPATDEAVDQFSERLSEVMQSPIPTLLADVRDGEQVRDVLSILFSMLSVELESASGVEINV